MLDTIYTILIAAGIVLPLLSLLFGGVDALLGGVDLDLDGDGKAGVLSVKFQHVNVIETIPEGGTGQVELTDAAGSRITYLAKFQFADFEPRGPIQAGTVVKVLDTENNLLVVGRLF